MGHFVSRYAVRYWAMAFLLGLLIAVMWILVPPILVEYICLIDCADL